MAIQEFFGAISQIMAKFLKIFQFYNGDYIGLFCIENKKLFMSVFSCNFVTISEKLHSYHGIVSLGHKWPP